MKNNLFTRRGVTGIALAAALAVTGFFGLKAATTARDNPPANVKTVSRSESAAGRGYSAVVKRVVPAVVNI